jgi:hypothetical protein
MSNQVHNWVLKIGGVVLAPTGHTACPRTGNLGSEENTRGQNMWVNLNNQKSKMLTGTIPLQAAAEVG